MGCCRLLARFGGGWGGGGVGYLAEKREGEEPYIIRTGFQLPPVSAHAFVSSR